MQNAIKRITSLPRLPARPADAHKGLYGHVLVVGGSRGMIGAVALATNAALRGGCGLASFAAPETVQLAIAPLCMCATSYPLACDVDGELAPQSVRQMLAAAGACSVIAIGPGMGAGGGRRNLVQAAIEQDKPLVIDADGLNNLAAIDGWAAMRRCPAILTPHPGEFSRLTGKSVTDIQADRLNAAVEAARDWSAEAKAAGPLVCVLKGSGTIVTDGRRVYVNKTGNPGMATGGTGDCLTGLAAAMLAQHLEPFEAACLAVHVHGRAGDLAAAKLGQVSLIASDLLDYLAPAIRAAGGGGKKGHRS